MKCSLFRVLLPSAASRSWEGLASSFQLCSGMVRAGQMRSCHTCGSVSGLQDVHQSEILGATTGRKDAMIRTWRNTWPRMEDDAGRNNHIWNSRHHGVLQRVHFRRNTKPNWSWKRLRISLKERSFESSNCRRRRWSSKASLLHGHLLQDIMKKQGFSTGDEEESTVARPDRMHQGISALWSISVPPGIGTNTTPLLAPLDRRLQPLHTG